MKKRISLFLLLSLEVSSLSGCFPYRENSQSQQLDQAIGQTQGAGTAIADYQTQQAQQEAQNGTQAPESPWYEAIPPSIGDFAEQFSGTLVPESQLPMTKLSGPPLFFVTTRGSGSWTKNRLYPAAGDTSSVQGGSAEELLGLGTLGSGGWTVEMNHGVKLAVYDTANTRRFYLVQPTVWIEFANLAERANGGVGATDKVVGIAHADSQHEDPNTPQNHAHGYSDAVDDRDHLIMVIEPGISVIVEQINESARMALVKLPPLWIHSERTVP